LALNPNNFEEILISELELSKQEVKLFILIIESGKINLEKISTRLGIASSEAFRTATSLIEKGMIIEVTSEVYQSLHPRFAISNGYRIRCQKNNIEYKKNTKVDNLGLLLELYYENARTK